ncbi:MAG: hypothetical protein ACK40Z_04680 [Dietzia sp.]
MITPPPPLVAGELPGTMRDWRLHHGHPAVSSSSSPVRTRPRRATPSDH